MKLIKWISQDLAWFEGEPKGVLGLILNSDLFDLRAKKGLVSETWIMDGDVVKSENDALSVIKNSRADFFKKTNQIEKVYFKHWNKAFPNYSVELERVLNELKPQQEVSFFANWTGALGIGSMIDRGPSFAKSVKKMMSGL